MVPVCDLVGINLRLAIQRTLAEQNCCNYNLSVRPPIIVSSPVRCEPVRSFEGRRGWNCLWWTRRRSRRRCHCGKRRRKFDERIVPPARGPVKRTEWPIHYRPTSRPVPTVKVEYSCTIAESEGLWRESRVIVDSSQRKLLGLIVINLEGKSDYCADAAAIHRQSVEEHRTSR